MKHFEQHTILLRYTFFVILMTLVAIAVVGKAVHTMTVKKDYWKQAAGKQTIDSLYLYPTRGDILSCDGQLLAGTVPEYKLFIDFQALHESKADTLWMAKEDSICDGLHELFPAWTADQFRENFHKGWADEKHRRHWCIWPERVDYDTYLKVRQLPIFKLSKNKSGLHRQEFGVRVRPNGSLAARTVGEFNLVKGAATSGIELKYDSLLKGSIGMKHQKKVLRNFVDEIDIPVVNGADVYTTIDIGMQDVAEKALLDELRKVSGVMGVAIVMEVETGDIKAIVNMTQCADGEYYEILNNAVGYTCEPGSVFKTASILAAIDDGKIDTSLVVNTGNGIRDFYGSKMIDWKGGGFGTINIARSMEMSSNIGISVAIENAYKAHPEQFVSALERMGIGTALDIDIPGYRKPIIAHPTLKKSGVYGFSDKTKLPWMSIGYATMVSPINTLTFYNAIANNGKMVAPRFVTQIVRDGEIIKENEVKVLSENICKHPESIKTMQTVLEHVVTRGTGKPAKPANFPVAGKTGTALIARGGDYKKHGPSSYWASFAGYFPADQPRYSCIVCIRKDGGTIGGGSASGVVFKDIAEGVMARFIKKETVHRIGSPMPDVKDGNILAANYLLSNIGVASNAGWTGTFATGAPIWGKASTSGNKVNLTEVGKTYGNTVPDVLGMGARDAVFLLESRGLKVNITGRGKVVYQSLKSGTNIVKGQVCQLELDVNNKPMRDSIPNTAPLDALPSSSGAIAKGRSLQISMNKKV